MELRGVIGGTGGRETAIVKTQIGGALLDGGFHGKRISRKDRKERKEDNDSMSFIMLVFFAFSVFFAAKSCLRQGELADFELVGTEVDKQSVFETGRFKIAQDLGNVLRRD